MPVNGDTSTSSSVTNPGQRPNSFPPRIEGTMVNHQESTFNMDVLQETRPLVP